ncbi:MAG: hypothetical protein EWV53_04330 [Microcystis panniformis Mp_MB_F_20051200_S9]|uniref:Uncharacterized protein n=1 Tax=Microcystis panniformis Mp_MB_F_20051200_S9 TaxID=2486223 RepID=A0A552Q7V6_9CHRO|nr:MAG: hypothetical protein EWV87_14715 [Microcystis panniformis Mp_GB_SS_20050300_S99]TRV50162.1 MAG: hypothetical protein EWV43_06800 [Microcystis panniformis Mp_MB_F_20080800_S26D]TRV51761.1 MAG: hypothetical protein EWV42_09230 [Microcystis panniformis Mp_GB_SS_20050300_S99D]TRV57146.1 MAG: hypothetical protein EWV86_21385 [Microcystis panniformis Mp_MB_F_20051200_S9D]TRV62277.1 MAG: hypothetical protein EWV69_06090 [Microcystis panniformis Mp_MB_F_20080800_S26]TRV65306.1 MAG: hypothetica
MGFYWVQIKETPNKSNAFYCPGKLRLRNFPLNFPHLPISKYYNKHGYTQKNQRLYPWVGVGEVARKKLVK